MPAKNSATKSIDLVEKLVPGVLVRRYKRFLADVEIAGGTQTVVHCPNPGSMLGCAEPGSTVYLRHSSDPSRKLAYTWVLVAVGEVLVSVDTMLANKIVGKALRDRSLPGFDTYDSIKPEVVYGDSRFDFGCFDVAGNLQCLIEVKATTLVDGKVAMFPDARTERGRKHLFGLSRAAASGIRAVQFYLIKRDDVESFAPAKHIDPEYAQALRTSKDQGVEVQARMVRIESNAGEFSYGLGNPVPVIV
jgi:sugar fermentation stimulation protein A